MKGKEEIFWLFHIIEHENPHNTVKYKYELQESRWETSEMTEKIIIKGGS